MAFPFSAPSHNQSARWRTRPTTPTPSSTPSTIERSSQSSHPSLTEESRVRATSPSTQTQSHRAFLQYAQAFPRHRRALRQTRQDFPRLRRHPPQMNTGPSVYFFNRDFSNGLQAKKIKKFLPVRVAHWVVVSDVSNSRDPPLLAGCPPSADEFPQRGSV
jgi:hypothetical protein